MKIPCRVPHWAAGNKKAAEGGFRLCSVERAMGIEPTALAWEARVLPLYDARVAPYSMRGCKGWASGEDGR